MVFPLGRPAVRLLIGTMGVLVAGMAHADFVDGNFASNNLSSNWNPHGYRRNVTFPSVSYVPQSSANLQLDQKDTGNFTSQSSILGAGSAGATGGNLTWTGSAARVNSDVSSGTISTPGGDQRRASSIEQTITVASTDIDSSDGKVHLRFVGSPVLEYASNHDGTNQAYYFIEVVKDDGTANAKVLYTSYNFADQSGVTWKTAGGYRYTDWVNFDIPLDSTGANAVSVNDKITLRVYAAGCQPTGHSGAFYLRDVRTKLASGQSSSLWVSTAGPDAVSRHTNTDGSTDITYTYTYTNNGTGVVNGVQVNPAMPVTSDGKTTIFQSISTPSTGTGTPVCTAPATPPGTAAASCSMGTLQPGETGSFTMTVRVPANTSGDYVNNGTFPISGTGVPAASGNLQQTQLLADMVPDLTGLPSSYLPNQLYNGSFSCTNQGATAAASATCAIANLPPNVTAGQCKITVAPGAPLPAGTNWNAPSAVPAGSVVTCPASGTPLTDQGTKNATVTTTASNDGDGSNNQGQKSIGGPAPDLAVDLTNLPGTATVGVPYTGSFTCTNLGAANATAGTSCLVTNLPSGLTQGACTIGSTPWNAGDPILVGQAVTCQVTGTPANNKGLQTVDGSTGGTGDANTGNNTAQKQITVAGVPHVVINLGGLPATGNVGVPYNGSFTCRNDGTADAANAICTATNLPNGVTLGACSISPSSSAWTSPGNVPEGETVTCLVSGKPDATGTSSVTGTATDNQVNQDVVIGAALAVTPVPTLSHWGQFLAGLMIVIGFFAVRRVRRSAE